MNVNLEQPRDQHGSGSIGTLLRTQRQRLNQEIGFVAEHLRIRVGYLVAIEEGRYDELPGSTYAIGFVRAYSEYLGLPAPEIVQQFKQENGGGLGHRSELIFPSPVSEGRIPGGAILFVGLLLAASAYGGWYYMSSREASLAELVPNLPEPLRVLVQGESSSPPVDPASSPAVMASSGQTGGELVPPAEHESEHGTAASAAAGSETVPVVADAGADTPEAAVAPTDPAPVEPSAAAPVAPVSEGQSMALPPPISVPEVAEPPAPQDPVEAVAAPPALPETAATTIGARVYGEENTDVRIILRASDDSWVQVRENNSVLLMRLMRKGDIYRVPNRPGLTLMTGSAGALDIEVDGQAVPPLGAIGVVRRDVALDPEKLLGN